VSDTEQVCTLEGCHETRGHYHRDDADWGEVIVWTETQLPPFDLPDGFRTKRELARLPGQ
jgi:hypothetical protein